MIPLSCVMKIGCNCKGQIIKWNVYLMIRRFCLMKIGCTWTRRIIKWKVRMPQKIPTSLLHSKNNVWRNRGPVYTWGVIFCVALFAMLQPTPGMKPRPDDPVCSSWPVVHAAEGTSSPPHNVAMHPRLSLCGPCVWMYVCVNVCMHVCMLHYHVGFFFHLDWANFWQM